MSNSTDLPSTSSVRNNLAIPKLVPCLGKCGFYGQKQFRGLCSQCHAGLKAAAYVVENEQVLAKLLELAGFSTIHEVKEEIAYQALYASELSRADPDDVDGINKWRTRHAPITQYDAVPQRGTSACTYIAAVATVKVCYLNDQPDEMFWADCIRLGSLAFHKAKAKDPNLQGHASVDDVLPYAMDILGLLEASNVPSFSDDNYFLQATTAKPKEGLIEGIKKQLSTPNSRKAVIIVRPPETYVFLKTDKDDTIFFRDSHRREQRDFVNIDSCLKWLEQEEAFFSPLTGCPDLMNFVGLYTFDADRNDLENLSQWEFIDCKEEPAVTNEEGETIDIQEQTTADATNNENNNNNVDDDTSNSVNTNSTNTDEQNESNDLDEGFVGIINE